MKRILLFLSSFLIVTGAAGAIYVAATGNAGALRSLLRLDLPQPPTEASAPAEEAPADPDTLLEQATTHFLGEGVPQDDARGAALVLRAAEMGNQRAIGLMGMLYLGGIGVDQDFTEARKWLALSEDAEGRALAERLLVMEAIVDTLPPEEREKRKAETYAAAHDQIRASFIEALRELRAQRAAESAAPAAESGFGETGYAGSADPEGPSDESLMDTPGMPAPAAPAPGDMPDQE